MNGDAVEKLVDENLCKLFPAISDSLTSALYSNCITPCLSSWKRGEIKTLNDLEEKLKEEIDLFMRSTDCETEVKVRTESWMKEQLLPHIQNDIDKIAAEHGVKDTILQLEGILIEQHGEAKGPGSVINFTTTNMIVTAVSAVVFAALCGGGGVALIAGGPFGLIIGAIIGIVAAFVGMNKAETAFKSADLPILSRKFIPLGKINKPKERSKVAASICESFQENPAVSQNLSHKISAAIDGEIQAFVEKLESQL